MIGAQNGWHTFSSLDWHRALLDHNLARLCYVGYHPCHRLYVRQVCSSALLKQTTNRQILSNVSGRFILGGMISHFCLHVNINISPAVARIANHTSCQWPSRLSRVNDFHFIWKSVCNFLLVINSNLGPISHCLATIQPLPMDRHTEDISATDAYSTQLYKCTSN